MDYNALKVAELKNLLKERGIPSTGLSRKQQIVEALESIDAEAGKQEVEVAGDGDGDGAEQAAAADAAVEQVDDLAGAGEAEAEVLATDAAVSEGAKGGDSTEDGQPPMDISLADATPPEPSSTQPTVLESNQPVAKEPSTLNTPRQTSPIEESTSSDRKRKRRSPTPPVDQETVSKKLKAADGGVATAQGGDAQGETVMEDAPLAETAPSTHVEQPIGDVVDVDARQSAPLQTDGAADVPDDVERPIHPPTSAIYISNLVRPIQHGQLSDYLNKLAAATGDDLDVQNVVQLHLGSIRTHAFATFKSARGAAQVRARLHGRVWPDEPARKALWVDFVPEDMVQEWIDRETEGGGRRDTRRWEVAYDETQDGIVARHHEAGAGPPAPDRRPSNMSIPGQGTGMPNAPLGPRGSRPSIPAAPPPKQPTPNPTSSASFVVLDEKFPSTTTKPKLYYSPVSQDLAERRFEELARQTSREWGARGGDMMAMGDVRRYTFEDGDRIVDGGPHYDDFSGPRGGGGMGRRRGGGGFRGRR